MKMKTSERGSVTLWAVIITTALLAVVGLVVDGSGRMRAGQRADQIAREAARTAAQKISGNPILGQPALIDVGPAKLAAQKYLEASGVAGQVSVSGGTITVTTTVKWSPVMLSAFGVSGLDVTGTASASAKPVFQGAQR